jgi:hypothetical protein
MSKRTPTTSAARQMLALNDCKVFDRHQWHATFTVGQYLCTTCGASYYCPGCTLSIPRNARARLCPEHHAEQEARDHAAHKQQQSIQQKGVPS